MRLNLNKFCLPKKRDITEWHRWFAWYPVVTIDGPMVWLETVERVGKRYVGPRRETVWRYRLAA